MLVRFRADPICLKGTEEIRKELRNGAVLRLVALLVLSPVVNWSLMCSFMVANLLVA
jgi:hypothetical protein